VEEICLALRLGKTACYRTLQRHRAGEALVQRHPSVRARIGTAQLQSLRNFIRCDETYYLEELQHKLRLIHNQTYALSLICRALKLLGLRHKKVRPVFLLTHGGRGPHGLACCSGRPPRHRAERDQAPGVPRVLQTELQA